MGLNNELMIDEDFECVEKFPEKKVRERRHLDLLEKIKKLPKGRIHPALPKLKGMERARRKLEKRLDHNDKEYGYDNGFFDGCEPQLDQWWGGVRKELSRRKNYEKPEGGVEESLLDDDRPKD